MDSPTRPDHSVVQVTCVYADDAGRSHLIEVGLPVLARVTAEDGGSRFVGTTGATTMGFVTGPGPSFKDWHVAGMAGLSIVLAGEWEIEAGSGARRTLRAGSVLLMLDTHGQGHRSHCHLDSGVTVLGVGIDAECRRIFAALVEQAVAARAR